ncbi:hypothetical protein BH11BAC2_BH11BAC2_21730 [soil metagenome]
MKKFSRNFLIIMCCCATLLQSGCYGKFALTGKLYDWNGQIGDKFVNSLVFFVLCVIPVYPAAAFVDAVIFNLIEFWSGSNPIAMKEGQHEEQLITKNGVDYKMEATKNQLTITTLSGKHLGKKVNFVYTSENRTWNIEKEGELIAIGRLEEGVDGQPIARIFKDAHHSITVALPADEAALATQMQLLRDGNVAAH